MNIKLIAKNKKRKFVNIILINNIIFILYKKFEKFDR